MLNEFQKAHLGHHTHSKSQIVDPETGAPWEPAGGSIVAVRVIRNAALSVANVEGAIAWDTEVRDDGGLWDASEPSRITFPSPGWYLVGGGLEASNSTPDWWQGYLRRNGTMNLQFDIYFQATTTPKALRWSQLFYFDADDFVEIHAVAHETQALLVGPSCNFWAVKQG